MSGQVPPAAHRAVISSLDNVAIIPQLPCEVLGFSLGAVSLLALADEDFDRVSHWAAPLTVCYRAVAPLVARYTVAPL